MSDTPVVSTPPVYSSAAGSPDIGALAKQAENAKIITPEVAAFYGAFKGTTGETQAAKGLADVVTNWIKHDTDQKAKKIETDGLSEKDKKARESTNARNGLIASIDLNKPGNTIRNRNQLIAALDTNPKIIGEDKKVEGALTALTSKLATDKREQMLNNPDPISVNLPALRNELMQYYRGGLITAEEMETIIADAATAPLNKASDLFRQVDSGSISEADALAQTQKLTPDVRTRLEEKLKEKARNKKSVQDAVSNAKSKMRMSMTDRSIGLDPTSPIDLPILVPDISNFSNLEISVIQEQLIKQNTEDVDTLYIGDPDKLKNYRESTKVRNRTGPDKYALEALRLDIDKIPGLTADYRMAFEQGIDAMISANNAEDVLLSEQQKLRMMEEDKIEFRLGMQRAKRVGKAFLIGGLIAGTVYGAAGFGGGSLLNAELLPHIAFTAAGGTLVGYLGYRTESIEIQNLEIELAQKRKEMAEAQLVEIPRLLERGAKGAEIAVEILTIASGRPRGEVKVLVEDYTGTRNYGEVMKVFSQKAPANYARAA